MHAAVNGISPEYIKDILIPTTEIPGWFHLRSAVAGAFYVPKFKSEFGRRAFSVNWVARSTGER